MEKLATVGMNGMARGVNIMYEKFSSPLTVTALQIWGEAGGNPAVTNFGPYGHVW